MAVLFLARGGMPLSDVWQAWLAPLSGLIPIQVPRCCALRAGCRGGCTPPSKADAAVPSRMQATEKQFCLPGVPNGPPSAVLQCAAPSGSALHAQMLYSFYVHSSRIRFKNFPPGDLFHGTLISNLTYAGDRAPHVTCSGRAGGVCRLVRGTTLPRGSLPAQSAARAAGWGDTTQAVRELLRAALLEPRNQRFILLSDADIPLYPATLTYLQLFQAGPVRAHTQPAMGDPSSPAASLDGALATQQPPGHPVLVIVEHGVRASRCTPKLAETPERLLHCSCSCSR